MTREIQDAQSTQSDDRQPKWLPILLIVWNLIDIVVHVAVDMAEVYRISGNIVCLAAALIVLLGLAKSYAPHVLGAAAVLVVLLNTIHVSVHGAGGAPMFVFIGVSLFLLLRWAQIRSAEPSSASPDADGPFHQRGWAALLATLVGVAIVLLASLLFSGG
jgi:hypothetical protein